MRSSGLKRVTAFFFATAHELRVLVSGGREARLFFYLDRSGRLIVLHAFIKKSRTTPKQELDLARQRMQQHQRSRA